MWYKVMQGPEYRRDPFEVSRVNRLIPSHPPRKAKASCNQTQSLAGLNGRLSPAA